MINKRTLLKYFAASATCSVCCSAQAQAQNIQVEGCMLSGASANLMLNTGKLSQSSGNQKVDVGSRNEYKIVSNWSGLRPGFAFFDDSDAPNAMATTQSILGGNHGTILYGKTLLSKEMATPGSPAASMIFMHEFAHILEFNVGVRRKNPELELLADFMAGWYLARVKGTMGVPYNGAAAAQTLFEKGDYKFNDPHHHGTPKQRVGAAHSGYETCLKGQRNLIQAFNTGRRVFGI